MTVGSLLISVIFAAVAGAASITSSDSAIVELWNGYRLDCRPEALEAEVTIDGVVIRSISENEGKAEFGVKIFRIGRGTRPKELPAGVEWIDRAADIVRIKRMGIVEELTTSRDGIRRDFIIERRPCGRGKPLLELDFDSMAVSAGVKVEAGEVTVRFAGGKKLLYSPYVSDASGKTLPADFKQAGRNMLHVVYDDRHATYPVRIRMVPAITDADWVGSGQCQGVGRGYSGEVAAIAVDNKNNCLYVGGNIYTAGGVRMNGIAKWDGTKWSGLGNGLSSWVRCVAVDRRGGTLYAGGVFTKGSARFSEAVKWDGSGWSVLGDSLNGEINVMAVDDSVNLFIGGEFDSAGSTAVSHLAQWNGTGWTAIGEGIPGSVSAIAFDAMGNLYAGGCFAGPAAASNIVKWDGHRWSSIGGEIDGCVSSLAFDTAGNLFAAGLFSKAGATTACHVAKWDGGGWSPLDSNFLKGTNVETIVFDAAGNLYAWGWFPAKPVESTVAKWDGRAWLPLGIPFQDFNDYLEKHKYLHALAIDDKGDLFAGAIFSVAGGTRVDNIARLHDGSWNAIGDRNGNGFNGAIFCFSFDSSGTLYAGGTFTTIGTRTFQRIAKWDGNAWSPLGEGVTGNWNYFGVYVNSLASDASGNLYAGGEFDYAGSTYAKNIAKWNGTGWQPLGNGCDKQVRDIVVDRRGTLYACGDFTRAGLVTARHVAKWDGTRWSSLANGLNDVVYDLAIDADGVVHAFTHAREKGRAVFKWKGDVWIGLGDDTTFGEAAAAVDANGDIYRTADDGRSIVKWDGRNWAAFAKCNLGWKSIQKFGFDGNNVLYVAGDFDIVGGKAVNHIARWDGVALNPLGSGLGDFNSVNAMAFDGSGNLFLGGDFLTAGGKPSPSFAICRLNRATTAHAGNAATPPRFITGRAGKGVIDVRLQSAADVDLRIYSPLGREAYRVSERMAAGSHTFRIQEFGLAPGVYVARVKAGAESMRCPITVGK